MNKMFYEPLFLVEPYEYIVRGQRIDFWILDFIKYKDTLKLGGTKHKYTTKEEAIWNCSKLRKEDLKWFSASKCEFLMFFDYQSERKVVLKIKEKKLTIEDLMQMKIPEQRHKDAFQRIGEIIKNLEM